MSAEHKKTLILRYYEEFDKGDLAQVEDMLAPNFVAYLPGMSEPLDRETFKQFALMFRSAFPDIQHSFEEVIVEGDKVVTRGTFTGKHQGKLQGLPPTGKHVTVSFIHIDRIVDGQIMEHWGQADMVGMLQQLGVIPLPVWQILKIGAIALTIVCLIGSWVLLKT
ncbi:ester cyclase [Allocoleopsis sp.]|uniref:ester cyclase n=1 Tax=Allocoleopsis sp. TaxID=3088169 RepID=UPI002FD37FE8